MYLWWDPIESCKFTLTRYLSWRLPNSEAISYKKFRETLKFMLNIERYPRNLEHYDWYNEHDYRMILDKYHAHIWDKFIIAVMNHYRIHCYDEKTNERIKNFSNLKEIKIMSKLDSMIAEKYLTKDKKNKIFNLVIKKKKKLETLIQERYKMDDTIKWLEDFILKFDNAFEEWDVWYIDECIKLTELSESLKGKS